MASLLNDRLSYSILPFAGTLKEMLRVLLRDLGLSQEEAERALFFQKEQPLEVLGGVTPRRAMQKLGTEWGRECIDRELWVRAWQQQLLALHRMGWDDVVADDMRFPEELRAVRDAGGFAVKVLRPEVDNTHQHASEGSLAGQRFDWTLVNDGDILQLDGQIDRMIEALTGQKTTTKILQTT